MHFAKVRNGVFALDLAHITLSVRGRYSLPNLYLTLPSQNHQLARRSIASGFGLQVLEAPFRHDIWLLAVQRPALRPFSFYLLHHHGFQQHVCSRQGHAEPSAEGHKAAD